MLSRIAALLFALALTAPAAAQTLTVEIDGEIDGEVELPASATATVQASLPPSPGAVVVVRPDDDHLPRPRRAPAPVVVEAAAPPAHVVVVERAAPAPAIVETSYDDDDDGEEGSVFFETVMESLDLSGHGFSLEGAEIRAARPIRLDAEWMQGQGLSNRPFVGGVGFGFGMRAMRYFRGPEVRFHVVGGEIDGPWMTVPGETGLDVRATSAIALRMDLALGVQLPLGPVTPYVMARGGIGGAWVDVDVRHPTLGVLGSETVELFIPQLGVEGGIDVETGEGMFLRAAYRGSFLGTESHALILGFGWHGE